MGKPIYTQKFRQKWKSHPKLRNWLEEDKTSNVVAHCKFCRCKLKCKLCDLLMHADTRKHASRAIDYGFNDDTEMEVKFKQDDDDADQDESLSNSPSDRIKDTHKLRKSARQLVQPRQKFCARWQEQFEWLKPDTVDETLGVCTLCNKYLVCKKSHLERHERSIKHRRMVNADDFDSDNTEIETMRPKATEFMECGKRESEDVDEIEQAIEMESALNDVDLKPIKHTGHIGDEQKHKISSTNSKLGLISKQKARPLTQPKAKLDRLKLLKTVDRDRHQMSEYLYSWTSPPQMQPRDSFDLFFESVSASVKTLPPKLATEMKSRVSQIMAEFELRAICEREALGSATVEVGSTVVVASTTQDDATQQAAAAVPRIVYTFQPKCE